MKTCRKKTRKLRWKRRKGQISEVRLWTFLHQRGPQKKNISLSDQYVRKWQEDCNGNGIIPSCWLLSGSMSSDQQISVLHNWSFPIVLWPTIRVVQTFRNLLAHQADPWLWLYGSSWRFIFLLKIYSQDHCPFLRVSRQFRTQCSKAASFGYCGFFFFFFSSLFEKVYYWIFESRRHH